ncbi:MAG: hypothetical protein V1862_03590, partial [Methanobacteriota archaeon]
YNSFIGDLNQLMFRDNELRLVPVGIGFLLFAILLFLPSLVPGGICLSRKIAEKVNTYRGIFLKGIYIIAICGGFVLITSLTGHSFLSIQYPLQMIGIGILSFFLILMGLSEFFTAKRFQLLVFAAVPAAMLILGVTRIIPGMDILWSNQIDPLRFLGYLWPPMAIIAGAGLVKICPGERWWLIGVMMMGVLSLLAAFPSVVFIGETFDQSSPFYDNRSLVISHPESEIQAIEWFGVQQGTKGALTSDRYAFSAARWLNTQGKQVNGPVSRPSERSEPGYWLLTSRMDIYANFVEWLTKTPYPVSPGERDELDKNAIRMYDNGDSVIYQV